MLNQDNTKLRKEVAYHFDVGSKWYKTGQTMDQKENGMMEVVKGLRKLKLWIERESQNKVVQKKLKNYYNTYVEKVQEWKKYIEDHKLKVQDNENNSG